MFRNPVPHRGDRAVVVDKEPMIQFFYFVSHTVLMLIVGAWWGIYWTKGN